MAEAEAAHEEAEALVAAELAAAEDEAAPRAASSEPAAPREPDTGTNAIEPGLDPDREPGP